jgi:hypothetical protein
LPLSTCHNLDGSLPRESFWARHWKENLVCEQRKSIYGLKQSGRMWYERMHNVLDGFERLDSDQCFYHRHDQTAGSIFWLALYVDDLLIASNSKAEINQFKQRISHTSTMKDLGEVKYISGIHITRDREQRTLTIDQQRAARFSGLQASQNPNGIQHKAKGLTAQRYDD